MLNLRGRRAAAGLVAAALAAGQFVTAFGGAASASASTGAPIITFGATSVTGLAATLSYSVNRSPQQIASVVCSLTPKGGAASSASCGRQSSSSKGTSYAVSLSGLNAGSYSYGTTVKLTDGGGASGSTSFTVKPVAASCTVTAYKTTYDGGAHRATGTCTAGGVDVSAGLNLAGTTHTKAGTYASDKWSFTDAKGNYTNPGGTISDTIGQATPSCSVSSYSTTFDGNSHTAAGACTGAGGVDVSADLNVAGTTHTNAGSYATDAWSFTDPAGNYKSAGGTVSDAIGKATVDCTVTAYSTTYDGSSHTATGSCTGAGGVDLSADLNLSATTHTSAGSYATDGWSFTDPAGNYSNASGTVDDSIAAATASCTVTSYSINYDGNPHTAAGSCTGLNGVALPAGDLNLTSTTHTNAGSYPTDGWSFTDPAGNYTSPGGEVSDTIGKAMANCTVTSYGTVYDGNPHTATGSCTGLSGASLPAGDLDLSGTTHTNAGDHMDAWSFTDPNYSNPGGTVTDSIEPVPASCMVTSYSVTYDGNPHSATGSCTGLNGVALPSSDLLLGNTSHTNAGEYTDSWTFSATNYQNTRGTVADAIGQATAQCTVTGYDTMYTGQPQSATGSCTGVSNASLPAADLDLSLTNHTDIGSYGDDNWSFHDPAGNYADQGDVVTDSISQATVNCTVRGYSVTYNGQAHTATAECDGAGDGASLPAADIDLSQTTHTAAGSYPSDAWSFADPAGNYIATSGTVGSIIGQATASCTVTGYSVTYDDNEHLATGSCTGVNGTALPASDLSLFGTSHRLVGTFSDTWSFTDGTGNYTNPGGTVTDVITTNVVCTVTGYRVTYDGNAHTATGSCSDGTTDLTGFLQLNQTTHTNAGTYTDTWLFHDPSDTYPDQSGSAGDTILKANATCTVTAYNVPFDDSLHIANGKCIGVGGVTIVGNGGLDLTGTEHTMEGTYSGDSWSFNATNAFPNYNEIVDEFLTDTIGPPTTGGTGGCTSGCII